MTELEETLCPEPLTEKQEKVKPWPKPKEKSKEKNEKK